MKAVVVNEPESPSVLKYKDVPTPQVKPNWNCCLTCFYSGDVNKKNITRAFEFYRKKEN